MQQRLCDRIVVVRRGLLKLERRADSLRQKSAPLTVKDGSFHDDILVLPTVLGATMAWYLLSWPPAIGILP